MNNKRQSVFITDNTVLSLSEIGSSVKRDFHISEVIGIGTSCIVYRASYISGNVKHQCILKELYPEVCGLMRDRDGISLNYNIFDNHNLENDKKRYQKEREKYITAYNIQLKLQNGQIENRNLNNRMMMAAGIFAPIGLYENENGILYTLYNYMEGIDYKEYKNSESVSDIIDIIIQIGRMTEAFHNEGYLVLDIKESNILVTGGAGYRRGMLFDFGSLIKKEKLKNFNFYDEDNYISFTNAKKDLLVPFELETINKYFKKQEYDDASCWINTELANYGEKTDLYLLSAILYKRLFGNEPVPKFKNDIWTSLPHSRLPLSASFENKLKLIFSKTLCKIISKRCSMTEFLNDLSELKQISLDDLIEKNSDSALMCHLYSNPLYRYFPADSNRADLLIIGFDYYGQKYLDRILPVLQLPGMTVNITVVSSETKDISKYLSRRPELNNFFDIDDSKANKEAYGSIRFINRKFSVKSNAENTSIMRELENQEIIPDHIFVSVGNDDDNLFIANSLKSFSHVDYIQKGLEILQDSLNDSDITAVYITEDIRNNDTYSDIERMAFNVHLVWNSNLNIKIDDLKSEFLNSYNFNSCLSFVIAMKYKLYKIGIDLDSDGIDAAAKKYFDLISSDDEAKKELTYIEHRRWNTEKICFGFSHIENLEECAYGKAKDEKRKKHGCLVRSSKEFSLLSDKWTIKNSRKPNKKIWDNPSSKLLSELDELDRMSVDLHLVYFRHALKIKETNLLDGEIVSAICEQIHNYPKAASDFQELISCMKNIWNDESDQCSRYNGLVKKFNDSVSKSRMTSANKKSVTKLIGSLTEQFYPVFASQLYQNYKLEDIKLVEEIPFILTYSDSISITVPYKTGDNSAIFSNLAVATVLNPSEIIYISYCETYTDFEEIKKSLPYISNYQIQKEIRARTEFIIGYNKCIPEKHLKNAEKSFSKLSSGHIRKLQLTPFESRREFAYHLSNSLISSSDNNTYRIYEQNDSPLSCVLDGLDFFSKVRCFRYDSVKMEFNAVRNCNIVNYIHVNPYITVSDMFAFKINSGTFENRPDFYNDYKSLWKMYSEYTSNWKNICRTFREYSEINDQLASFDIKSPSAPYSEYSFTIPSECSYTVGILINTLKSNDIISGESSLSVNGESCLVKIVDKGNNKKSFEKLFSRHFKLFSAKRINFEANEINHTVTMFYNDLTTDDLDCKKLKQPDIDLIEYLYEHGYLISLDYNKKAGKISFTYPTSQVKEMLTNENRLLEVYIYHSLKETGYFDDIRSSIEIDWNKSLVSKEFDCVLTKGFSVIFIECNNASEIRTDFYNRIFSLVHYYGINATAVLIADTQDNEITGKNNVLSRKYGERFDVLTISDRSDIQNIGKRILEITG